MSLKRSALLVGLLSLALAGPFAFPQDGGAGNPDDIASVLPEDAMLFAEIVRPGKIYQDRLEYLGAFCAKEGKAKVLEQLEKALKQQGDGEELPEKLQKDLEKGFPSVQRVAVFLSPVHAGQDPSWAVVATAAGEAFFKDVVDDLRVFAGEEKPHQGTKILIIRKVGKHQLPFRLCVAAAGKRLVLSTNLDAVMSVLDRAAGKGKGGDLRKNASYARFGPTGEDPSLRAFAQVDWAGMTEMFGGFGSRRSMAHGMDLADAALGFRKFKGATLEATLKPGKITSTTRLLVDSPCPIYDIIRQPAGPKDTLKLVPDDAQVAAHLNLRGGKQLLNDIDKLVKRFREIEKKSGPKNPAFAPPEDQDWKKGFEHEIGLPIDEVAAAIGTEVAFAMVGHDALAGEQNVVGSLLFGVGLADADKAKAVIEKVIAKMGPYEAKKEGDTSFWIPQQEGGQPVFAIQGKIGLVGTKLETIKKALKTGVDGKSLLKQLPAGIAASSKTIVVRNNALWSLAKMGAGGKLPDIEKDLDLEALSTLLFIEDKNEWRLTSTDAGLACALQAVVMMVPLGVVFVTSIRMPGAAIDPDEEAKAKAAEAPKESPALPPDKLAAEVKKHLAGMKSDDVVSRDDSEAALRKLGPQAAKLLADAVRKETDAEVKGRITGILSAWKAYDAFPELLKTKTDGFLAGLQKITAEDNFGRFPPAWRREGAEFPDGMEPMWVDTSVIQGLEHRDLLDAPLGVRALAERLTSDKLNVKQQKALAAVFAYNECGAAGDLLVAAKGKVEDAEAKTFLQIALGWSSDAKAKEALLAGLRDQDVWMRRATFLGLDRSKDTNAIPRLVELLSDKDPETRWNASFTLRHLTGGKVSVNVYVPEDEFSASVATGRDWWEKNKATFKIGE